MKLRYWMGLGAVALYFLGRRDSDRLLLAAARPNPGIGRIGAELIPLFVAAVDGYPRESQDDYQIFIRLVSDHWAWWTTRPATPKPGTPAWAAWGGLEYTSERRHEHWVVDWTPEAARLAPTWLLWLHDPAGPGVKGHTPGIRRLLLATCPAVIQHIESWHYNESFDQPDVLSVALPGEVA